jgi:hypothetical protein
MTKVMSSNISNECQVFKKADIFSNFTILNGEKPKGLNFYDTDGHDHNSDYLRKYLTSNPCLKYLSMNVKSFTDLTLLIICGTKLKQINEACFRGMPNLKQIDFSFNKIDSIEQHTFKNLNVEKIILSQNKIRIIRDQTFVDLPKLTLIDLHNNEIHTIEEEAFVKLPHLNKLLLSFNLLTNIKSVIFDHAPNLAEMDFHYNKIDTIEFRHMSNLEKLDLSKNRLKQICKYSFRDLPMLKELNLTNNQIEVIEFGSFCHKLPLLESCDLRCNPRLKEVDFLILCLVEKKIYFDLQVKLVEYSRLDIETLLDLLGFYENIECYDSATKEIFFKLNGSLFISIDLDDYKYQKDHILSDIFFRRIDKNRNKIEESFWIRVYDSNKKRKYKRDFKQVDYDLEKRLNLRFKMKSTERGQLEKVLNEMLNRMKVDFKRSKSEEACKIFFRGLKELKLVH